MTVTANPFAGLADKAAETERQQAEFRQERANAVAAHKEKQKKIAAQRREARLQEQEREQIRQKIRATIQRFIPEFTKNVEKTLEGHTSGPDAWSPQELLDAGAYVLYLTTIVKEGNVPPAPLIKDAHAAIIRDKFVWGLLLAQHLNKVTIPDTALVGQAQDWYSGLLETKRRQFDAYIAKRTAPSRQQPTDVDDTDYNENDQTESEPLTEDKLQELVNQFKPQATVTDLKPAITLPRKREDAKRKRSNRRGHKAPEDQLVNQAG